MITNGENVYIGPESTGVLGQFENLQSQHQSDAIRRAHTRNDDVNVCTHYTLLGVYVCVRVF